MSGFSPLEHPVTRRKLQIELATTAATQSALAEKYGVTQPSISEFKARHLETINAIREDQANEFAGIALAEKANRLAVLADLVDKALQPTPKITNKGTLAIGPNGEVIEEIDGRMAAQAIKQIAEELGQLPTRLNVSGEIGIKTNYTIAGVDPGNLS